MRKFKMPNGDVLTIPEGMSVQDGVRRWKQMHYDEHGYDPNVERPGGAETNRAVNEAGKQFIEQNPVKGRMAAYHAGARNLTRNLANMVLPKSLERRAGVTDQDIRDANNDERALKDNLGGYYLAGEAVTSMAGGAGVGAAAKAGAGGRMLTQALSKVPHHQALGTVAGGATVGAATAGPDDRTAGAMLGAVGGAGARVLHKAGSAALRGVAPMAPAARRLQKAMGQTPNGEEVFIPAAAATNPSGKGAMTNWIYNRIMPHFPNASRVTYGQMEEVEQTFVKNLIRQAYGKHADEVIERWKDPASGRLDDALRYGDTLLGKSGNFTKPARNIIKQAGEQEVHGEVTPKLLGKAARENMGTKTAEGIRNVSDDIIAVVGRTKEGIDKTVIERGLVARATSRAARAVGFGLAARGAASKGFQNFLMGNAKWQRAIEEALNRGNEKGLTMAIERAMAAFMAAEAGHNTESMEHAYQQGQSQLTKAMREYNGS